MILSESTPTSSEVISKPSLRAGLVPRIAPIANMTGAVAAIKLSEIDERYKSSRIKNTIGENEVTALLRLAARKTTSATASNSLNFN